MNLKRHLQVAGGVFLLVTMPLVAIGLGIGWLVVWSLLQEKTPEVQKPEQPYEGLLQGAWRKLRAYW